MSIDPIAPAARIADLIDRLGRYLRSREHGGGLNPAQWEALRYLARANRYSRSPSALTEFLGSTKGTVSQTLIALESKGLIERRVDSGDRRQVRLSVTAAGTEQLAGDPLGMFTQAAASLGRAAQIQTAEALEGILRGLQLQHDRKTFGICRGCRFLQRDGAAAKSGGPHRCGLTGEPLSLADTAQICVEEQPAAAHVR